MTGPEPIEGLRPAMFAIAYRMLGGVADAEDVVQEGLLRLHQARERGERITSERAYLSTVVTRLAIDHLRSARVRREHYVGEWLPEPLPVVASDEPAERAELADSLSFSFLVLMESLTPEQRAAFLLREVFDYPYAEVAEILGAGQANTRQLVSRARREVEARRPRFESSARRRQELAERFMAAALDGDLQGLEALLAEDVVLHGDGGGKAPALARPLLGASRVAGTLLNWLGLWERAGGAQVRPALFNGHPGGLLLDDGGRVFEAVVFEIADERIVRLYSVVNPDKLGHLGEVAGSWSRSLEPRDRGEPRD